MRARQPETREAAAVPQMKEARNSGTGYPAPDEERDYLRTRNTSGSGDAVQRLSATQGVRKKKSIALTSLRLRSIFIYNDIGIGCPAHGSKLQHQERMCRFQCLLYDTHLASGVLRVLGKRIRGAR